MHLPGDIDVLDKMLLATFVAHTLSSRIKLGAPARFPRFLHSKTTGKIPRACFSQEFRKGVQEANLL